MPKFALRYPFFILMLCLIVSLVGTIDIIRMPVDLFPKIDMPVDIVNSVAAAAFIQRQLFR